MVCARCAKKAPASTALATPSVKRKNDSTSSSSHSKPSATLGSNGIGKSKLLSKSAKNPYAAYSASCSGCKVKVDSGKSLCQRCAFKQNACAMCGKSMVKKAANSGESSVQGQRFSAK